MKDKERMRSFKVVANLKDRNKETDRHGLAVYIFSHSGKFIDKKSLIASKADDSLFTADIQLNTKMDMAVVKIGPDMEDISRLKKHKPLSRNVSLLENNELVFEVNKSYWLCWLKYAYYVTGNVQKTDGLPICAGEVDIYDIDIRRCLLKLPDLVIEKIRKGFIDVVIDPPPFDPQIVDFEKPFAWGDVDDDDWCGTPPKGPFPFPKRDVLKQLQKLPKEWNFASKRYLDLDLAVDNINVSMKKMSLNEKRVFLDTELAGGVKLSQIMYTNTTQFRTLLIDHFVEIRYWLCWWPWIFWLWWPYCGYSMELLGTTVLKPDGSFDEKVWLSVCRNDTPDLWFKVRQNINGIDRVIFAKYPVPCNTYWNHPSGKAVTLLVTDPNAIVCHQDHPGIESAYVLPMGVYEDEWYEVENAHIKSHCDPTIPLPNNCGLFNSTDPYGTRLDFRMQFHDDIYNGGIRFYKWSYRKHGHTAWNPIGASITHRHIKMISPGKYTIDAVNLGPTSVGTNNDLFRVPDPSLNWLSNRDDLAYAIWHTAKVVDGIYVPQVSGGKYDLRLEMFDTLGNKVHPSTAGFKFILPTASVGILDDTLFVEADGSLIMHLHIDNQDTVADIKSIKLNGLTMGNCTFLEYVNKLTDEVSITYDAYHPTTPNNFLHHYNLYIKRGLNASIVQSLVNQPNSAFNETITYKIVDLLGTYSRCAFTVSLHTYPRTRNGHSRIRAYEASDSSAFAILEQ